MIIEMRKYGKSLSTRSTGRKVYKDIVSALNSSDDIIIFDFSDVYAVTNSFADEVFGRLILDNGIDYMKKRTTFQEVNDLSEIAILFAIKNRQSRTVVCC